MYLLSLRLAPSPWVGIRFSATAQYTVPSVSTQTVTPRRVGVFACANAPPRAEPAGPSVWCTMILRQGWAFDTSPHGASQTTFRPGISGVPDPRAIVAKSDVSANAGPMIPTRQSTAASRRRRFISTDKPSRVLAQGPLRHRLEPGHQWRRGLVHGIPVLAFFLGGVKRVIRGRHQPIREQADVLAPLCNPDR